MNEPEFDKNDPLWKTLDAFSDVEPHLQSRTRLWSVIARGETARVDARGTTAKARHEFMRGVFSWRWLIRFAFPAAGFACAIAALAIGGRALIRQHEADREIAANLDLYQNLEVIQNMAQLASYDQPDEDFDETVE